MSKQAWSSALTKTSTNFLDLAPYKGAIREERGKFYVLVKTGEAVATAGLACVYSAADVSTSDGDGVIVVKQTAGATITTRIIGVSIGAIGNGEYAWLQWAGSVGMVVDAAATAGGLAAAGATNAGRASDATTGDLAFGIFLETKTTGQTAKVWLLANSPSQAPVA